ncbi:MAG: hypothetical protein WAV18_03825 [Roseiarcus sp.]
MSVERVENEIARFLADPASTVLCLRGKWGVGKTHAWDAQVRRAQAEKKFARSGYSKVSLFGLTSLDAVKHAIFENTQWTIKGARPPSVEAMEDFLNVGKLPRLLQFFSTASKHPYFEKLIGGAVFREVAFMSVREEVVCIDDFERRGDGLKVKDVLGLIAFLCEQRKCKVALILNDEKLGESERADFESNLEKVVDISLRFDPGPSHVAKIGATDAGDDETAVAERSEALGITNIRIVKRVCRLIATVKPVLAGSDPEALRRAISSLCLACWCRDEPEEAPPFDSLEAEAQDSFAASWAKFTNSTDDSPEPPAWKSRLAAYDHPWSGDFDLVLIEGVRRGWFDDEKLAAEARKLTDKLANDRAAGSFEDAWRRYHDSFDADQEEVLDGIRDAFHRGVNYVSPMNVSGTVALFKKLARAGEATEMIARYVEARRDERKLFDLDDYAFGSYVVEPEVREAFARVAAEPRETPGFAELLAGAKEDLSAERMEALAAAATQDYVVAFKTHRGPELRRLIANALQFFRIVNATAAMHAVAEKARVALRKIGAESPINALRVANLGILVEETAPTSAETNEAP